MSSLNLLAANAQWASRPADERFWNLRDARIACENVRAGCATARVPWNTLTAQAVGDDVCIVGKKGNPAHMTHYAFGQIAAQANAPAGYLRGLPAPLAAQCLSTSMTQAVDRSDRDLLFHNNGHLTLRAALSQQYGRIWDAEVFAYLEKLDGWLPPAGRWPGFGPKRTATAADILPGQKWIDVGDDIGPAGIYASEHDAFAFLCAPDRVISDGSVGALMRGIFVRNSEVGDSSLVFTFFLCQSVCGNHIVWGAQGVHEIRVRHVGDNVLSKAVRGFETELRRYRDGAAEEEAGIIAARKLVLGNTKDEVLEALVKYTKTHSIPLSRQRLTEGYETAETHVDWYGNPRTLWANVAGLTQASQATKYTDERDGIDRAAGRLMAMAF